MHARTANDRRAFPITAWAGVMCISVLLGALSACGGGGGGGEPGAPTLNNVQTTQGTIPASMTVDVNGQFSFSDAEGDLGGGSFNYTYAGQTVTVPLPSTLAGVSNATVGFTVTVTTDSTLGPVTIPCWLVDAAGHRSNTFDLTLQQIWTRQFGTNLEDIGVGIAADSADNLVVVGSTLGNLDGEANPGSTSVFVTKYSTNAGRAWTRVIGSSSIDFPAGVATDASGNVYLTGSTVGTLFDGEPASGTQNGFVTKLDGDGNRQWTRIFAATSSVQVRAIALDGSANIYVTGTAHGTLNGRVASGSGDVFLIKFDTDGNHVWTEMLGTFTADDGFGVTTDDSGNAYVTGGTSGQLGADPWNGATDAFVAKFDPAGTLLWVTQFGTTCTEWAKGIAVGSGGLLYVTGKITLCAFPGSTANGRYDVFVARLGQDGGLQWVRQFGTQWYDSGNGIATDAAGNAYVTGYLDSTTFNSDSEGNYIFLAKYDSAGNQLWLDQQRTTVFSGNQGLGVAVDGNSDIFVTGSVHGAFPGFANANISEDDAFILGFSAAGVRR